MDTPRHDTPARLGLIGLLLALALPASAQPLLDGN